MASRVYCVLFNGEFDALAIRIRELDDIVYRFVVVESDTTFSGLKKAVQFTREHPAIQKFAARLDFVLVDDMPATDNAWDREVRQRNAVMLGLCGASDNDLILMSDVDEIPRPECVGEALADEAYSAFGFRMNLYYFYMNYKCLSGDSDVVWTVGAKFALLRTNSPDALRYAVRDQTIGAKIFENGGWHFSYLMDEETIIQKVKRFPIRNITAGGFCGR
jgi:beta-1,4-mannosyl-glycoprotein beta-1,4-N-acetylglucosaminyltransferase